MLFERRSWQGLTLYHLLLIFASRLRLLYIANSTQLSALPHFSHSALFPNLCLSLNSLVQSSLGAMSKRSRATQFDDDDGDVKPRLQVPSDDEIEEEEEDEEMGLEDEEDDGGESEDDGPRSQPYFKKRKGLPEQEFGTLSLKELYRKIKRGEIRLDPKYQRGDVVSRSSLSTDITSLNDHPLTQWSPARRSLLINSLFKNLHIPELLFNIHDTEDDDGSTTTVWDACDGKQRMTSIYKFMQGEFPVVSLRRGFRLLASADLPSCARCAEGRHRHALLLPYQP